MANGLKPQPFTNSAPSMFDGLQGRTKELVKDLRFAKEGKPQPSMFDGLQGRTKELVRDLRFTKEGKPQPSITEVYQQLGKKMESLEIINQQNRIVREEEGL